jgi:hypothetical protein
MEPTHGADSEASPPKVFPRVEADEIPGRACEVEAVVAAQDVQISYKENQNEI